MYISMKQSLNEPNEVSGEIDERHDHHCNVESFVAIASPNLSSFL